jgi:hypothetical protein
MPIGDAPVSPKAPGVDLPVDAWGRAGCTKISPWAPDAWANPLRPPGCWQAVGKARGADWPVMWIEDPERGRESGPQSGMFADRDSDGRAFKRIRP